jgi:hypothetical protein
MCERRGVGMAKPQGSVALSQSRFGMVRTARRAPRVFPSIYPTQKRGLLIMWARSIVRRVDCASIARRVEEPKAIWRPEDVGRALQTDRLTLG